MFREMRRKKQVLTQEKNIEILNRGTSGVLALLGDEGYPYAIPISYVYRNEKLYFHGAKSGHKLDAIRACNKASFCVIDQDHVVPPKYTTFFRSVIAFGKIRILEDEKEILSAAESLAIKYYPESTKASRQKEIETYWEALCIMEFSIEHITGKESIELKPQNEGATE